MTLPRNAASLRGDVTILYAPVIKDAEFDQ